MVRPDERRVNCAIVAEVITECQKQRDEEGWSIAHEDGLTKGELSNAAAYYAVSQEYRSAAGSIEEGTSYKVEQYSRHHQLVIAAALLVAEIARLDRLTIKEQSDG